MKSFGIALLFSYFLFSEWLGFANPWIESLIGFAALVLFLRAKHLFWIGFFIGLLWFWWIGLSFRYYGFPYLVPVVPFIIALVYGLLFWVVALVANFAQRFFAFSVRPLLHAAFLLGASSIAPFHFNWFIPELLFIHTPFGLDKAHFALILVAALFVAYAQTMRHLLLAALPIGVMLALAYHPRVSVPLAPLRIKLVTTHIAQDQKWLPRNRQKIITQNLQAIDEAIAKHYDAVVLPESAFPLFLDRDAPLMLTLLDRSHHITIVTGALHLKGERVYNSTYLFQNGRYQIFNKVVLVPFGEEIPLPKFLARPINRIFFGNASDFSAARKPQTYIIKGVRFTNAICYEATSPIIYRTPTRYIIAMSNNAWFLPSYEPILQNLIIKYYATIYGKCVYHATNIAQTRIIR